MSSPALASGLIVSEQVEGGFTIAANGHAPSIFVDDKDAKVVLHAAKDLADDIREVTGASPQVRTDAGRLGQPAILVGTLGENRLIDRLVSTGKIDVSRLKGVWEGFVIATVDTPYPGVDQALVVVGSDRRGTAYGVYELTEAIGVSPWTWWADVRPQHKSRLMIAKGTNHFGPPSVQYRGLFINDEDWGLYPWAAKTFDPAKGNIGPKTYERVFQLLLRLKANTLWPAMHKTSAPFNSDPANARLADEYGIVMGSSHAEPMLRNNVGEWTQDGSTFNYATNGQGVRRYWEERVRSNAGYESLWTLGMRGIHDSGIVGAESVEGKVRLLDTIIADQRRMLSQYVKGRPAKQMFMPYKEVLDLYRGGLTVPDDVTIIWPDDNFGYIRQFPNDVERRRSGGMGVYYHLSYLGAPLSYLWLYTTPPALVQEEMTRAWDAGARTVWIANAGDIKPAEIGITLFMEMAWDIDRWRGRSQREFLDDWAGRTFGAEQRNAIGGVLDQYYRANFERRPEHLQWWLPGELPRHVPGSKLEIDGRLRMSSTQIDARLEGFESMRAASGRIASALRSDLADAYFELIDYPVRASAAANRRFFGAERYDALIDHDPHTARAAAAAALDADREIKALTLRFNDKIAGGKWRHIMAEEPADSQWRQYRTAPVSLPAPGLVDVPARLASLGGQGRDDGSMFVEAEQFAGNDDWRLVQGLGRGDGTMVANHRGVTLRFEFDAGSASAVSLDLLPLYPDDEDDDLLKLDVRVDGGVVQRLTVSHPAESKKWIQGVLDNLLAVSIPGQIAPGRHSIEITSISTGIALDRIHITPLIPTRH